MDGMDMSSGGGSMNMMNATFYGSQSTPLWSPAWIPSSTGGYAGTCVFLIVLGAAYRGLLAFKSIQEQRWTNAERDRRLIVIKDKIVSGQDAEPSKTGTFITTKGEREEVRVLKGLHHHAAPWRLSVDVPRAAMTFVIAGVGYLL